MFVSSLNYCVCVSCCSAVSHSVMSEMQVIEQESPIGAKSSSRSKLDMFDEPGFTSGPPKYAWYLLFFFCLLLYKWVDPVWFHALPTFSLISCTGCFRYKDNPFTVGDSFGSRWDTEGGTASFTTSWALEKEDPKEEVTISSIQPIGERYLHPLCLLFFKTRRQCWLDCDQLWCAVPCLIQTSQQKKSRGVGSGVRVERGQTEVCKCEGDLFGHVLWSRDQRRGEKLQITELQNHFCPAAVCFIKVSELCRVLTQIFTLI